MATNRQLAQQARQHQKRLQSNTQSFRQIAQQARQTEEHKPIARKPLLLQHVGTISICHRLNRCDTLCIFCGADHWIDEKVQSSTASVPKFLTCCQGGTIAMEKFERPPQPLYSLLIDLSSGIF